MRRCSALLALALCVDLSAHQPELARMEWMDHRTDRHRYRCRRVKERRKRD